MNDKILITGGAGFIGSHLCERLINAGEYVICMDNFETGKIDNINHLMSCPRFELMKWDVTEEYNIPVKQIYNLACPASPAKYQIDRIKTAKTNFLGAYNAIKNAIMYNARILQASTSEVYGNALVHPQTESYYGNVNPIGPRACYDEGKRIAETLLFDSNRQYGIEIRIARIFNTYGPRMDEDDGRVVSNFIVQALQNSEITVYGDGKQTRSFCYIEDTVKGLISLMNQDKTTGPVNIGNPEEITIIDLAELVIKMTESRSHLGFRNLPQDDPYVRCPSISNANLYLGWAPSVPLEQGLQKTISYYEERNNDKG